MIWNECLQNSTCKYIHEIIQTKNNKQYVIDLVDENDNSVLPDILQYVKDLDTLTDKHFIKRWIDNTSLNITNDSIKLIHKDGNVYVPGVNFPTELYIMIILIHYKYSFPEKFNSGQLNNLKFDFETENLGTIASNFSNLSGPSPGPSLGPSPV
jgi:hypothetical protein